MKRTLSYFLCGITLFICVPAFSEQKMIMLSLNEAKHYHAEKTPQKVYIQADRFQRKANANYYKLIVQSAVKSPVHVVHHQGFYSVAVGPLASATSIKKVAGKLKYDPGLTAVKHPRAIASSFKSLHRDKKTNLGSHKQLAAYERWPSSTETTDQTTSTEQASPTTEPSATTEPTAPTEKPTTAEPITSTEPTTQPEEHQQDNTPSSSSETQQDDSTRLDSQGAQQTTQDDHSELDEQARQAEQGRLDAPTKQVEKDNAVQAKTVKRDKQVKPPKSKFESKLELKSKQFKESTPPEQSRWKDLVSAYATGNWIVSAGGGASYPSFGSSMGINNNSGAPAPFNMDTYTTKSRTQPIVALSAGYRWARNNQWLSAFSLNLSYQHLFSRNVGGTVIQYSDPEFTNYNYDWEVSSDILMGLLKANIFEYKGISPYVLGGVGAAFNRASNYSEGQLSGVTPRTNPAFSANSMTNFAYRVGAGLEYQIDPQILVSAEYQFQSIGNIISGKGAGSWSGQYLNLGSYQSNAVLLNVTYLFGAMK